MTKIVNLPLGQKLSVLLNRDDLSADQKLRAIADNLQEDSLDSILVQLKIMNMHLSLITNTSITEEDV